MFLAVYGDMAFCHGLEKGGLGPGAGAVNLIGHEDVGEDGAWNKVEAAFGLTEDGGASNIGGEEVGGELDTLEATEDGASEGAGEEGLADAGEVSEEEVAAGQEADGEETYGGLPGDYGVGDVFYQTIGVQHKTVNSGLFR